MKSIDSSKEKQQRRPLAAMVFFGCFYLYIWLVIEPSLIYQGFGTRVDYPVFWTGFSFLGSCLSRPSGLLEYLTGFLSHLYYFSWLGALIITLTAWCIYRSVQEILVLVGSAKNTVLSLLPVILLTVPYNRYDNQLTAYLALSAALWFFVVYVKISADNIRLRAVVFMIFFALLYYVAGGASIVFAAMAVIYEILITRRRVLGISFLAVATGTYFASKYFYDFEVTIFSFRMLTVALEIEPYSKYSVIGLYVFFPLLLITSGIWQRLLSRVNRRTEVLLIIIIFAACFFASFESTRKKLAMMDSFANREMWPEVLETAHKIRPESYNIFCIHDVNRALYHTGRLGDDMFSYPQTLHALLLTSTGNNIPSGTTFFKRTRLLMELGHIADAERDAFEFTELIGSSPLILEQLATIKLIKGQPQAARIFLNAMSRDLIHGKKARDILNSLQNDPELKGSKRIPYLRSIASDKQGVNATFNSNDFFRQLLNKNDKNKLAFEYMMAFHLLTGQVDKVVENLGFLNDLGYRQLPQCYEEAIVIYMGLGRKRLDLHGWQPSLEILKQAKEIDRIYKLSGGKYNRQATYEALVNDFGKTYFFYYIFEVPKLRK
jgi:hypothetical protein